MPTVEVHILCRDEEAMLPWTLAHYTAFATRVFVYDAFSVDRSREIAHGFGAHVVDWHTDGINDHLARDLKNRCWQGTEHHWVICVDCDEILYSPRMPMLELLHRYDAAGVRVAKPVGWEMCADVFPPYEHGRQLYDIVTHGARAPEYGKPVLFAPRRVRSMNFGAGAHDATPFFAGGGSTYIGQLSPTADPPLWLCHFKHLGPINRVAQEYALDRQRLSETNRLRRWGCELDEPLRHAREKRLDIMSRIERVIPVFQPIS